MTQEHGKQAEIPRVIALGTDRLWGEVGALGQRRQEKSLFRISPTFAVAATRRQVLRISVC